MAMMWRILVAALVLGILGCDREAAEDPGKAAARTGICRSGGA